MRDEGIEAFREMLEFVDEEVLLSDEGIAILLEHSKLTREEFLAKANKILKEAKQ
jgi:hypothetical protein